MGVCFVSLCYKTTCLNWLLHGAYASHLFTKSLHGRPIVPSWAYRILKSKDAIQNPGMPKKAAKNNGKMLYLRRESHLTYLTYKNNISSGHYLYQGTRIQTPLMTRCSVFTGAEIYCTGHFWNPLAVFLYLGLGSVKCQIFKVHLCICECCLKWGHYRCVFCGKFPMERIVSTTRYQCWVKPM